MGTLEHELFNKKRELGELIIKLKHDVEKHRDVDGRLRINCSGNRVQYYHITQRGDKSGKYITKDNIAFARQLAQKDYDQKALKIVERKMKCIDDFLSIWQKEYLVDIYENLHEEKRKMITPVIETDEMFVERWESIEYEGKAFREDAPELYTSRGERVRSKSEIIIADLLAKANIPYKYECPLELNGLGIVYPDFTVLDVSRRRELYWEHLGMMDDPDYVGKALKKIEYYKRNGIFPGDKLIITQETRGFPIDQRSILREIQHHIIKSQV
ncbi:MAG: hypothetical protein IKV96_02180 [Firmicutes bacterium]|nr:hypothetical protein [Bacillota bacterium]